MDKDKLNNIGLTQEHINTLREYQNKVSKGESVEPEVFEALRAIDIAGKIINSISSGEQIDPVFLKNFIDDMNRKINKDNIVKKKKVKKKRKFKIKK